MSRFTDCDSSTFPSITNYNFEENIPVRGINDRSFRWEDVSIRSIYLYDEATLSGSFEPNRYTENHDPFPLTYSGYSFITEGFSPVLVDLHSFTGWTITGGTSVLIGSAGLQGISGQLQGLTGTFKANPIHGNTSIGLYTVTGTTAPAIISKLLPTGEGFIVPNNRHQVYLQSKASYTTGSIEKLKVYPRGWNANSIVAYYHPFSGIWSSTPPASGFLVPMSGYTEIKYLFTTSNFPGTVPTGYDLYIQPETTGGFIIVDDVHIDSVLKKNAFVDYTIPSGYLIQITPDLGWHNVLSMFSDTDQKNPHLRTLGPYSVPLANLTDNEDNTVTATIDLTGFQEAINDRVTNYLWRALAISPDGIIGEGGIPNKFEYIGQSVNKHFSIVSVSDSVDNPIKVIVGTKSNRSSIKIDGISNHPGLEYPTDTSWKLSYPLNESSKTITIQAIDSGGATSDVKYIELTSKVYMQNTQALWNVFDEHGLLMDVERLPAESNIDYSLRIKDTLINMGGANFSGIVNGGIRELGLSKIRDALTIAIKDKVANNVLLEVNSTNIKVRTDSMLIEELLLVDPVYHTITISKPIFEYPISCVIDNRKPIKITDIEWDKDNDEYPTQIRLFINDPDAYGKHVSIRYQYYEQLNFKEYPTIGSLSNRIREITDQSGIKFLDCSFSDLLSGGEDSLGLFISFYQLVPGSNAVIPWAPFFLKKIADKNFREYCRNTENYRKSKFYKYVSQLKMNSRVLWGSVEADRDYWDAADRTDLSFDTIPTLNDPPLAEFYSMYTGASSKIDSIQAWGRNYIGFNSEILQNIGISTSKFQPGVSAKNDLEPDIYIESSQYVKSAETFLNISTSMQDNNLVLFSGQR